MTVFFVYIDWTLESSPRVFYVGKGNERRVGLRDRDNSHWKRIASKYGWRREVVLATKDEAFALDEEKRFIKEHRTFQGYDDYLWGANKTLGGEGTSGLRFRRSPDSIERQRCAQLGKKRGPIVKLAGVNHPMYGKHGRDNPNYGSKRSVDYLTRCSGENSPNAVMTWALVTILRERYAQGEKQADLARAFDITPHSVYMIVHNKTWKTTSSSW